jgi:hypothetical protein
MNLPPLKTHRLRLVDYKGEPALIWAEPGDQATHTFTTRGPVAPEPMALISDQDEIIAINDEQTIGAITDALVMIDAIDQVIIVHKVILAPGS